MTPRVPQAALGPGPVVVFGAASHARVYHYLLARDSPWTVAGFTANERYVRGPDFLGLPLVPFERLAERFPPDTHALAIPLSYHYRANRLRAERFEDAIGMGYRFVSYTCSKAVVWDDLALGVNSFVHEGVVIQPGVRIGHDVIVAPGALIGHDCTIGDHAFIGPRSAVLGTASVGPYCVIGANATIVDGVRVGEAALVGAGALVTRDVPPGAVLLGTPAEPVAGSREDLEFLFGRTTAE